MCRLLATESRRDRSLCSRNSNGALNGLLGRSKAYVVDVEGGVPVRVTDDDLFHSCVIWSPDGAMRHESPALPRSWPVPPRAEHDMVAHGVGEGTDRRGRLGGPTVRVHTQRPEVEPEALFHERSGPGDPGDVPASRSSR